MATGDILQATGVQGFAVTSLQITTSTGAPDTWSTPTSGNTLIAVVVGGGNVTTPWSGWTRDVTVDSGANDCVDIWRRTSNGTESTITVSFDTNEDYAVGFYEIEGVVTFDKSSTNTDTGGATSIASGSSGTLTGTTSLAIAGSLAWDYGVDHTYSNSYTVDMNDTQSAMRYMAMAHKALTGTTATSTTASWTNSAECAIGLAVYTVSSSVDDTATLTALSASSTFSAVTMSAGATSSPNDLGGTATFDAVSLSAGSSPEPSVLDSFSGFPAASALATQDGQSTPTALAATSTFPSVTTIAIDGEVVHPTVLAIGNQFTSTIVQGEVNSPADPATAVFSATFDAVTAYGQESDIVSLAALTGAVTFPSVATTTTNNEDVPVTALAATSTFPIADAQARELTHFFNSDVGVAIEVAFDDYPLVAPPSAWYDITGDVRSFTISRGRKSQLDEYKAGVATLLVDANQGNYNPTNASSPYYPNVIPMKQVRIRASYDNTTYTLFRGFIENWPMQVKQHTDEVVSIKAVDGLKLLAAAQDSTPQGQENSATRIGNLLDEAGWPAALRTLGAGAITVPAFTPDCGSVLSLIRTIKDSEGGQFYIAANGNAVFRNRTYRSGLSSVATYGDSTSEIPYQGISFAYDDSQIWNRVQVTIGGFPSFSSSTASQDKYGIRQLNVADIQLPNSTDGNDLADIYVDRYKEPKERIESITFKPEASPSLLWPQVLGRDLGEKVTVVYRTNEGHTKALGSYIESVSHRVSLHRRWQTQLTLSQYV